jgi:hypothetical protein
VAREVISNKNVDKVELFKRLLEFFVVCGVDGVASSV